MKTLTPNKFGIQEAPVSTPKNANALKPVRGIQTRSVSPATAGKVVADKFGLVKK